MNILKIQYNSKSKYQYYNECTNVQLLPLGNMFYFLPDLPIKITLVGVTIVFRQIQPFCIIFDLTKIS